MTSLAGFVLGREAILSSDGSSPFPVAAHDPKLSPMNIAIVIERFVPSLGGNERSTQYNANRLISKGHTVTVFTNEFDAGNHPLPQGEVVAANGPKTKYGRGIRQFGRWATEKIRGNAFDVSLSVTTAVPANALLLHGGTVRESLRQNVYKRQNTISRSAASLVRKFNGKRRIQLQLEAATFADANVRKVIAISRYVAHQLSHHYGIEDERTDMNPIGAAVEPLSPEVREATRHKSREALGLNENQVAFLFAAMNPQLKGITPLLHAFANMLQDVPNAVLLAAGGRHDGPRRLAKKLGVDDRIQWLGPRRDMVNLYTAADVTVLPTWYDPCSLTVIESLLYGTPALSTLYNGASQWIWSPDGEGIVPSPFDENAKAKTDGQDTIGMTGRVITSPDDVEAMARALLELANEQIRAKCVQNMAKLTNMLDIDRHVDQLERTLADIAARG